MATPSPGPLSKPRPAPANAGASAAADPSTPLLEPGDHLSRIEFERRYQNMPYLKKAELIDGVVYMPSPVRMNRHGRPHALIIGCFATYVAETPGVTLADNASVRLDLDDEPQPDALLLIDPERGGQARISLDDYVEGAPELAAEIASSSAAYDLHEKFRAYQRAGVREYLVWRVLDRAIDFFSLREGRFEPKAPDDDGAFRSEVFPGLRLHRDALLAEDYKTALETVRKGTASPEHAEFVGRLNEDVKPPT